MFMTVMFHDIEEETDRRTVGQEFADFTAQQLLYADDTLLVGKSARTIHIILRAIERESDKYNMRLNKGKCCQINMNCNSQVEFSNGQTMSKVYEATYLGGQLNAKADHKADLTIRMGLAAGTWKKLTVLWNKTNADPPGKFLYSTR